MSVYLNFHTCGENASETENSKILSQRIYFKRKKRWFNSHFLVKDDEVFLNVSNSRDTFKFLTSSLVQMSLKYEGAQAF